MSLEWQHRTRPVPVATRSPSWTSRAAATSGNIARAPVPVATPRTDQCQVALFSVATSPAPPVPVATAGNGQHVVGTVGVATSPAPRASRDSAPTAGSVRRGSSGNIARAPCQSRRATADDAAVCALRGNIARAPCQSRRTTANPLNLADLHPQIREVRWTSR